jgi:hypothetical protein
MLMSGLGRGVGCDIENMAHSGHDNISCNPTAGRSPYSLRCFWINQAAHQNAKMYCNATLVCSSILAARATPLLGCVNA